VSGVELTEFSRNTFHSYRFCLYFLGQSSSVFGKASEIKISDFEKHVVEGLLEYMYKGKTHIIPALAEDFLRIADFYLLSGLIVDAEAVLSANITAVNAVHNYQVGETYRLPSLKLKVVEFVQK